MALTSINADGWSATYGSPPTFDPVGSPETFSVDRAGFNASGSAVTVTDTVTLMKRVRQPYPNQASLSADQVALSDYVYSGETISGVTNNSTRAYPKPIAMWVTRDLQHIRPGEDLVARLSVIHAHGRSGRPVAAVKFIATDGTNSVEQTVSTMSSRAWSASGLWGAYFECSLDISTLNQGALCTLDAIIYPWVGAAFQLSVDADAYPSVNLTTQRFLCDRTGAYGTAYAYVDGVGGGTPAVSTTPATAEANPYATVAAAASAIQTYNNANFGRNSSSGGIIRLKPGSHNRTSFSSVVVTDVPLVIEADDIANKASVIFRDNGVSVSNGIPDKTCWRNMTFQRTSGSSLQFLDANATISNLGYLCALENVHIDQNGQSTYDAWIYRLGRLWLEDVTGGWSGIFNVFSTTSKHIHMVGCQGAWTTQGSLYHAFATRLTANARMQHQAGITNGAATKGMHVAYCHLTNKAQQGIITYNEPIDARGFGVAMTVLEQTAGLTQVCLNMSSDAGDACQNAVRVGVTAVGSRVNTIYQDAGTTFVDKSGYEVGCVYRGRNTKSDVFAANGTLTGNWPAVFQTGNRANAIIRGGQDSTAVGVAGAWVGEVAALGGQYGTDASPLAVDWVDDASFDGSALGGGDYSPGPSSVLGTLPGGYVHYPIDMLGRTVPTDGTAIVGALQPASGGITFTLDAGSYTQTGQPLGLLAGRKIAMASGSYALTGQALGLRIDRRLALASGAYALSGYDIGIAIVPGGGITFTLETGSYAQTGQPIGLALGRRIALAAGSYGVTGQPLGLRIARQLLLGSGAYSLTGYPLALGLTGAVVVAQHRVSVEWGIPTVAVTWGRPD